MITDPNTTQRKRFAIDQRAAREREDRITLWMVMTRPVPNGFGITTIAAEEQIAAKRRKLGFS